MNEMSVYIGDFDLLAGNTSSKPRAASLFPEYAVKWIAEELNDFSDRPQQRFFVTDSNRELIRNMCKTWDGHTHYDLVSYHLYNNLSDVLTSAAENTCYDVPCQEKFPRLAA